MSTEELRKAVESLSREIADPEDCTAWHTILSALRTHHAEIAAAVRDKRRMDWLESEANKPGGLLLHDGSESGRRGLGLRPGYADRTLREAVDSAMRAGEGEG